VGSVIESPSAVWVVVWSVSVVSLGAVLVDSLELPPVELADVATLAESSPQLHARAAASTMQ